MENSLTFHKKTFFPSSENGFEFNYFNSNQIYFTSGNKLILYDFIEEKKIFRINTRGKKIIKITQSLIDNDLIYILDIENVFYQFKISTKEILNEFELNKKKLYFNFQLSRDEKYFYFISSDLQLIQIEKIFDKKFIFKKIKEIYLLNENELKKYHEDKCKNFTLDLENNSFILCSINNDLILYDMIKNEVKKFNFQKKITSINIANNNNTITIGDFAGKIHIIDDINNDMNISTKHWHSHKINDIISDPNDNYFYSCGLEGVIVIWNCLNNYQKTFLPRLNDKILKLKISNDSKFLAAYLKNNIIKIINLSNKNIISNIFSISNENIEIKNFFIFNPKSFYIIYYDKIKGNIIFYNINQNNFPFDLNIFNKNYTSKTEKEISNNLKILKEISISTLVQKTKNEISFMMTLEELNFEFDNKNNNENFIEYIKFWKIEKKNIILLDICENSHLNEKIFKIVNNNFLYSFCTISEHKFKIWKIENEHFYCDFEGKYKNEKIKDVSINNNLIENNFFVLYEHFFVMYKNNKINNIFSFEKNMFYNKIFYFSNTYIILSNELNFTVFDFENFEIVDNYELKFNIKKFNYNNNEKNLYVFCIEKNNNEIVFLFKFNMSMLFQNRIIFDKQIDIKKNNIIFFDLYKKYIILVNNKNDFFLVTDEKKNLNDENKKIEDNDDDKDIELNKFKKNNN